MSILTYRISFLVLIVTWYVIRVSAFATIAIVLLKQTIVGVAALSREMADDRADTSRTAFTLISHSCLLILGFLFGSRVRMLDRKNFRNISFINALVLLTYFFSTAFVLSAALLQTGLGLYTQAICDAAVYCCISFYFTSKGIILIFLTERAHAIRAHKLRRLQDPVWYCFVAAIVVGFGAILTVASIWPNAEVSDTDGICRIGLPLFVTAPMMSYEILINVSLTGIFIWLLQPLSRNRMPSLKTITVRRRVSLTSSSPLPRDASTALKTDSTGLTNIIERETSESIETLPKPAARLVGQAESRSSVVIKDRRWIDKLAAKSMIGTSLVLIPVIGNLGLLSVLHGKEQGWICFSFCTVDVMWAVCVLHWLTSGSLMQGTQSLSVGGNYSSV